MELDDRLTAALQSAERMILDGGVPCVFLRGCEVAGVGEGTGVRPLIDAYDRRPELLRGTVIVDRIVGKAAAMVAVLGGAAGVYGLTMSDSALAYLDSRGIPASCAQRVEHIVNRTGTGLCPMEQSVLALEDPAEGLEALRAAMRRLSAGEKQKP